MSMDRDSFSLLATRMRSTPITSPIEAKIRVNCRWRMAKPNVGVNKGGKMLPGRGNIRGWRKMGDGMTPGGGKWLVFREFE